MKLENNVVLLTGGATGIGLGMAERFVKAGSEVIIVGRRQAALDEAKKKLPQLVTRVCDVSKAEERAALADWVVAKHPTVNVLFNNAGVQRFPKLTEKPSWEAMREEIATNFDAPVHLSTLLFPHLARQAHAAIINTTSGLAYIPWPNASIYCATKAALHSFTDSLRAQADGTSVEVIELSPPHVETDLGAAGANTNGMPLAEYIEKATADLVAGDKIVAVGFAKIGLNATRAEVEAGTARLKSLPAKT